MSGLLKSRYRRDAESYSASNLSQETDAITVAGINIFRVTGNKTERYFPGSSIRIEQPTYQEYYKVLRSYYDGSSATTVEVNKSLEDTSAISVYYDAVSLRPAFDEGLLFLLTGDGKLNTRPVMDQTHKRPCAVKYDGNVSNNNTSAGSLMSYVTPDGSTYPAKKIYDTTIRIPTASTICFPVHFVDDMNNQTTYYWTSGKNCTVEMMIYLTGYEYLNHYYDSAKYSYLYFSSGLIRYEGGCANGTISITSNTTFPLNTWTHFALTEEHYGNTVYIRMFQNGVLVASQSYSMSAFTAEGYSVGISRCLPSWGFGSCDIGSVILGGQINSGTGYTVSQYVKYLDYYAFYNRAIYTCSTSAALGTQVFTPSTKKFTRRLRKDSAISLGVTSYFASTSNGSYPYSNAFDNVFSTYWAPTSSTNQYVGVQFSTANICRQYIIHCDTSAFYAPTNFSIQASNVSDFSTYVTLDTKTNAESQFDTTLSKGQTITSRLIGYLNPTTSYSYYRLYITSSTNIPHIYHLDFLI